MHDLIDEPLGITGGPDGALWFTNFGTANSIGRITTGGVVTNFTASGIGHPDAITNGPDGAPLSYKFHHKNSGRQVQDTQTLAEAQVQDGDILRLQPEITAG